ncbi:PrsW family glutamic-type intramembrane protease [Thermoflexus sp.]|uniref:PrsW family glutamic-type intramembrane protease n=1 Tax=Thermoflexus sp. TaxID=1969742 RepID=UPI0035E42434
MNPSHPEVSSPIVRAGIPAYASSAGLLWMGAGALAGGLLFGLWLGLAALAAMLRLPIPAPGLPALGLLVGGGLFREGRRIARGEPDALWRGTEIRAMGRTLLFLLILIGCGAMAEAFGPRLSVLVLPFHVGVSALGPFLGFNLLCWRLRAPWSRRAGWWALSLGSLLVPALALFLEGIVGATLILLMLALRILVEGPGFVNRWFPQGFTPERLSMPPEGLVRDPWLWIGILILAVIWVPAIEEALKALPAGLRMRDPAASGVSLILYGAMGGAGFALAESMLSWQPGIPWTSTAIGRLGATALHVLNGGLMGWAWDRVRRGRFLEGAIAYLFAWLLHGLWNAGAIVLSGLFIAPLSPEARALALPPAMIGMGAVLLLVIGGLGWALPMLGEVEASHYPPHRE